MKNKGSYPYLDTMETTFSEKIGVRLHFMGLRWVKKN